MIKADHTNAPTADLIRSMRKVIKTLDTTRTSLLSAAVRLAEAGQDEEAQRLVDLAKALQDAEHEVFKHIKDARSGMIVKLSKH